MNATESRVGHSIIEDPVIEAYKSHLDRTLIRENLKRTPEERVLRLMDLQRLFSELRKAGGTRDGGLVGERSR